MTAARACASADALVFGDVAVWSAVDAVWEGVSSTDVDFADQRTLEHFLVALHPRFRPRVLLERCVDWDNHRGAAIVCQLQGEFAEELRCQFAHLGTAFPVPPAERSDAQQRRVVATAIDLASMYADNATSESQRTSLIGNVRGCAASPVARMVTSLAARYGGLLACAHGSCLRSGSPNSCRWSLCHSSFCPGLRNLGWLSARSCSARRQRLAATATSVMPPRPRLPWPGLQHTPRRWHGRCNYHQRCCCVPRRCGCRSSTRSRCVVLDGHACSHLVFPCLSVVAV